MENTVSGMSSISKEKEGKIFHGADPSDARTNSRRAEAGMQAPGEASELFALLEGGASGARAAEEAIGALYHAAGAGREPWLVRGLLCYHARTGSSRAIELLARAPEPHARLALDALAEQLRAPEPAPRHRALAALAELLARRPPWLHLLLPPSPVPRELARAARRELAALPQLHALLALAALLPAAPALTGPLLPELAEALTRATAQEPQLSLGARALFAACYATHPCSLVEALRGARGAGGEAWERAVRTLARGVRLHPALVTGSRRAEAEAEAARRGREEPHEVLAECARLALPPPPDAEPAPEDDEPPPEPDPAPAATTPAPTPVPGSGAQAARGAGALRPGGEGWFALGERSGAEAAPHTPLPEREPEPGPDPEPAVEATPENTPARLARQAFRFPAADSPAARAIGRTPPPAPAPAPASASASHPPHDACAARLARVAAERRAQDSPVPLPSFGGAPPLAAARPEPRLPSHAAPPPPPPPAPDREDSEVRELTARAERWREVRGGGAAGTEARELARPLPRAPRAAPPPRRPASCGPPHRSGARRDAASQTVDTWPEPYEFLLADLAAELTVHEHKSALDPVERLDRYLGELYAGAGGGVSESSLAEQLALAHAQLMYERWRRDAHAERNRRLLGRCRAARALELANAALQERVRELQRRQRRETRQRRQTPPPAGEQQALERALAEERAARLRAEAALRAAEERRARDAAELQRVRGESFEAARHVEALARAALAAERRAEHVRRLRRELLLLAEREARLGAAVRGALEAEGAGAGAGAAQETERALRAACARAEAEAEALGARAEAGAARTHELEALLATREAALAELKRSGRAAAEEGAARLRAVRDKYAALLRVVRATGARDLERRAAPLSAPPAAPPAAPLE